MYNIVKEAFRKKKSVVTGTSLLLPVAYWAWRIEYATSLHFPKMKLEQNCYNECSGTDYFCSL
jgi:hypothetical protein